MTIEMVPCPNDCVDYRNRSCYMCANGDQPRVGMVPAAMSVENALTPQEKYQGGTTSIWHRVARLRKNHGLHHADVDTTLNAHMAKYEKEYPAFPVKQGQH